MWQWVSTAWCSYDSTTSCCDMSCIKIATLTNCLWIFWQDPGCLMYLIKFLYTLKKHLRTEWGSNLRPALQIFYLIITVKPEIKLDLNTSINSYSNMTIMDQLLQSESSVKMLIICEILHSEVVTSPLTNLRTSITFYLS